MIAYNVELYIIKSHITIAIALEEDYLKIYHYNHYIFNYILHQSKIMPNAIHSTMKMAC